jgi:hypothetical protein
MSTSKTTESPIRRRVQILILAALSITSVDIFPQENINTEKTYQECISVGDKRIEKEKRKKAAEKCIIAANNGDPRAFSFAGLIFATGDVVEKNEKLAVEYWTKGARLGDSSSIRMMAILFENGQWVKQDIPKSKKLYEIAADLGDRIAIKKILEQSKHE